MSKKYDNDRSNTWIRFIVIIVLICLLFYYNNLFIAAAIGFFFADWMEDSLRDKRLLQENGIDNENI